MSEVKPIYKIKKPYRSPDELVAKLRDRGMSIPEEEEVYVKSKIRSLGYYRLSGYFGPLQSTKDVFKEGVTFNDVMRLYWFDDDLRHETLMALRLLEIALKTKISDTLSSVYESDWYLSDEHFMSEKTEEISIVQHVCENGSVITRPILLKKPIYQGLIEEIRLSIERNKEETYIKKYHSQYGDMSPVPSWMMMECVSFGKLSRLYSLLKNSESKKIICKHFGVIKPDMFSTWLHGFVVLRNACAHHARIWNKKLMKDLEFPRKSSSIFYTRIPGEYDYQRYFYGISGCLLWSLKHINEDFYRDYKSRFYELVDSYEIDLRALGFPKTLANEDVWRD